MIKGAILRSRFALYYHTAGYHVSGFHGNRDDVCMYNHTPAQWNPGHVMQEPRPLCTQHTCNTHLSSRYSSPTTTMHHTLYYSTVRGHASYTILQYSTRPCIIHYTTVQYEAMHHTLYYSTVRGHASYTILQYSTRPCIIHYTTVQYEAMHHTVKCNSPLYTAMHPTLQCHGTLVITVLQHVQIEHSDV